nr:ankyrin-3 isoform X1 [Ipomoea batatas]
MLLSSGNRHSIPRLNALSLPLTFPLSLVIRQQAQHVGDGGWAVRHQRGSLRTERDKSRYEQLELEMKKEKQICEEQIFCTNEEEAAGEEQICDISFYSVSPLISIKISQFCFPLAVRVRNSNMVSELADEGAMPLPAPASQAELRHIRLRLSIHRGTLKDINQYMELKFVYPSFINDGDDISRSAIFKDRSLSKVLIRPLFVVFDHTSWNRSKKSWSRVLVDSLFTAFNHNSRSRFVESMSTVLINRSSWSRFAEKSSAKLVNPQFIAFNWSFPSRSVEISSRVHVNPTFSVFNRNSWSSESLRLVNPLCIVVLVNTTALEKGEGSIAKMWSRSTKKNWSTLIEFFVSWFFLAGKQVFPVNYEDEVSQRLLEASHSNDLAATLECLQDSFTDVNFVGDVCLKVRKAEVVLREESPNEIGYEDFKTDVTALFLAVRNVALVRKLLSIGADVNQKFFPENYLEILEMLLKAGDSQQVCERALLEASCYGHAKMDILVYYLQGGQVVCIVYEMAVVWVQNQLKQKVVNGAS